MVLSGRAIATPNGDKSLSTIWIDLMDKRRHQASALVWLSVSLVVIVLDQASKAWVLARLPEFTPVPVIDGYWNWYRTYNTGAAFSFLSQAGGWQKWFFSFCALTVSALLVRWLQRLPRQAWQIALPSALVIGGALGNVIDRCIHGYVIDFIQWYVGRYVWPAFNIADSAIVVGTLAFCVISHRPTVAKQPAAIDRDLSS